MPARTEFFFFLITLGISPVVTETNASASLIHPDEIATFVMSTTSRGSMFHWYTRSVPSMLTWTEPFENVFFVMPDNTVSQSFVNRSECSSQVVVDPKRSPAHKDFPVVEYFCNQIGVSQPKAIILTSHPRFKCTDDYRGDGPCCKCNYAYFYALALRPSLLDKVKWFAYLDDDVYVHPTGIRDLLTGLDFQQTVALMPSSKCFRKPFRQKGQADPRCDQFLEDMMWAHPVWLSRAALLKVAPGILAGGIRDQCSTLGSSHESGLGMFLWMYQIGCAGMKENGRGGDTYSPRGNYSPTSVVVHRSHPENQGAMGKRLDKLKVNNESAVEAIREMKTVQIHDFLTQNSRYIKDDEFSQRNSGVNRVKWPRNYRKTAHKASYNIFESWVPFRNSTINKTDCSSP